MFTILALKFTMVENSVAHTELAYDLRQIYALLVGEHLKDIAEKRKSMDYYNWFKALEDLKTEVAHKFKKDDDIEKYDELVKKISAVANKCEDTWIGKSRIADDVNKIEKVLRDLEQFLYKKMEEAKMFGEVYRTPGL